VLAFRILDRPPVLCPLKVPADLRGPREHHVFAETAGFSEDVRLPGRYGQALDSIIPERIFLVA
jgi:hypothetical protein